MNEAQMTTPHIFRCPISLDLFQDPVTLCTGQTYDRSSIEQWLAAGNLTCPVTMQKLHDLSIVPNHTLRHLIQQWLQLGPQFDPSNSAAMDSLASIKHTLQSQEPTLEYKFKALEKILVLPDEYCFFMKSFFLQLGFLPLLLELVFARSLDHMGFVELALSCILKLLPLGSLESCNILKEESKLATFLLLFEKGSTKIKASLCHLIYSAATSSQTEEACFMLGSSHKLVQEIVLLLGQNCEASEAAIKAISAICCSESNMQNLIRAGAIDGLIMYISGYERREKQLGPLAMLIMEKLLILESGKKTLVNNPNSIKALVKIVFSFRVCDEECSEGAVGLLLMICGDFWGAREEAISAGVVTQLLLLLQSQSKAATKTKARMLLKLLTSKWAEKPKQA